MAEITYTKPTWVNGSGQAIDATELNALSTAVDQLTHAVTRALAGKELDANTVSGYGIGVAVSPVFTTNAGLAAIVKGGLYAFYSDTEGPFPTYITTILHTQSSSGNAHQIAFNSTNGHIKSRNQLGGAWYPAGAWWSVWNSNSDGPGSGLDADTVSGYGIGVSSAPSMSGDANDYRSGGVFYCAGVIAHDPYDGAFNSIVLVIPGSSGCIQLGFLHGSTAAGIKFRSYNGTNWGDWQTIYTSSASAGTLSNDGNAGQPPAAKSNRTSNATIGWIDSVDCASGGTVTLPDGGTFETEVTTYGATYNSVKCAIVAGGSMSGTASANLTMRYKRLS